MGLGEFIKVRRTALSLTQESLARVAGCSARTVSNWETESSVVTLTPSRMLALCHALDVRLSELASHEVE